MHEMTIAASIARTVADVLAAHHAGNPVAVHIRAGSMTGIIPEALREAFSIAAPQVLGMAPELLIDSVPSIATCSACQTEFEAPAFPACCPRCGSIGVWASGGDELELVSVEVEDDEDDRREGAHPQGERPSG